jgi:hypothetical protein
MKIAAGVSLLLATGLLNASPIMKLVLGFGRSTVVAENTDIVPSTAYTTNFFETSDCHGVTVLVSHSPTSVVATGLTLNAYIETGIADGAGAILETGIFGLEPRVDAAGTTFVSTQAGREIYAPKMRVKFSANGNLTHITRAVLFCQP